MFCFACGEPYPTKDRVEFRARCPKCDAPLHACLNCRFYDKGAYNQCREPKAERVTEKKRANHCEYFTPAQERRSDSGPSGSRKAIDDLFNI